MGINTNPTPMETLRKEAKALLGKVAPGAPDRVQLVINQLGTRYTMEPTTKIAQAVWEVVNEREAK